VPPSKHENDDSFAETGARAMRRLALSLFVVFAMTVPGGAAPPPVGSAPAAPVESLNTPADFAREYARLAAAKGAIPDPDRFRRLLAVDWRDRMLEAPEYATVVGYPGQNARWSDISLEAIARRKRALDDRRRAVESIDRARLGEADRLDYDLFKRAVDEAIDGRRFPEEYLAVTQMSGVQQDPARIMVMMPAATVRDYEDMIARLKGIPVYLEQATVLLKKGLETGVTPPKITLRDVPAQAAAQVVDDPLKSALLVPFTRMPESIPPAERERLTSEASRVYRESVRPAFERLRDFLTKDYVPRCRESIAASALPDGEAWYAFEIRRQTTTTLAPKQIHDLGLSEVKRIRAAMDAVMAQTGFKGSFAEFCRYLRTDPKFYYTDPQALVTAYRDIAKRVDPELVRLFGRLPRLPYGVIPVPAYAEKSQTTAYYEQGSLAGARPGHYFVNTYDLASRPKWEMEPLTLHESVPGHHLQIALAQEMDGLPDFRKNAGYTAFVEGWALYAESLGPEIGMYEDPYAKFGQLTYEMWRAVRLVVDTGIHAFGWSRQQAIDYFKENAAKTDHDIEVEVDRYIVWPGQALAYKLGELKIKELRVFATKELGERFDVRAFHDEVLSQGALPLDVLDARVRAWVTERGRAAASGAARAGGAAS
jgi:uncharacterized protein (DUF885 family)